MLMDHLGKWYLGFRLYPSIWFGLRGKGFGRSLCVEEIKEKQNWGNKVFFPKFRGQVVFCHGVCGGAILDDKMWFVGPRNSQGK
jgi:hypothetical protein